MFDQIIILRKPRIKHRKPGLAVDQSSFLAIEIRFPFFKSFLENVLQQKTRIHTVCGLRFRPLQTVPKMRFVRTEQNRKDDKQ